MLSIFEFWIITGPSKPSKSTIIPKYCIPLVALTAIGLS
jgi:hypothetical protein